MPIGHGDVKRQGSPKAIGKDEKYPALFRIQITLNIPPDSYWVDCFRSPSKFTGGEAHPKRAEIYGNILVYSFSGENLKDKIEWVDRYINQANECYHRKIAKKEAEKKRQQAKKAKEKEELESINKMLEKLCS